MPPPHFSSFFFLKNKKRACRELKNRDRDGCEEAAIHANVLNGRPINCIFSSETELVALLCLSAQMAGQSCSWFVWLFPYTAAAALSCLFHSYSIWIQCSSILHMDLVVVQEVLEVTGNTVTSCISMGDAEGKGCSRVCKELMWGAEMLLVRM